MIFLRTCRAGLALASIVVPFIFLAGPVLYAIVLWDRIVRVDTREHRRRIALWQEWCGETGLRMVAAIMGIRIRISLPPPPWPKPPCIIVGNHLGGFDGLLVTRLLRLLFGRADIRAVGKREVASWPIVGRAWRDLRWGFVARNRDPRDLSAVEECGAAAAADGATALIFPEGTVYARGKGKDGYVSLLPPKSGGLKTLVRVMGGCPVLSVTIVWDRPGHGRGIFDGIVPLGRRVRVEAAFVALGEEDVEAWLQQEWQRKDAIIANAA